MLQNGLSVLKIHSGISLKCVHVIPGNVPFDVLDGRPYVVADYGCQDGGSTMPLLCHVIGNTVVFIRVQPICTDFLT